MRRFIHKLRQKPKSTRRKIAFGTSASITGVIFAVWLTVMIAGGGVGSATGSDVGQSQTASPLNALENNAASAFTAVRDELTGTSTATTTSSTTTASSSQQSATNTEPTTEPTQNRAQTVDRQPYWEANDRADQNSEGNAPPPPPTQTGSDYWNDSSEQQQGDGWF